VERLKLLLDSTVLIHFLRGREGSAAMLVEAVRHGHTLSTSAVNVAEVYAGIRSGEESITRAFLSTIEYHPVTKAIGERGGRIRNEWLRKGKTIGLLDALVAATALEYGLTIVTDNRKDFPMPELNFYPSGNPNA
jgi:predicted nucleic acid-binding protein